MLFSLSIHKLTNAYQSIDTTNVIKSNLFYSAYIIKKAAQWILSGHTFHPKI